MKDRLQKLMDAEGLNPARFADEIGVQRSSISHILSGRNKPSYDFIIKILHRFKGINADWLLTGQGNMIKGLQNTENRPVDSQTTLFKGPNTENSKLIPSATPIPSAETPSTSLNTPVVETKLGTGEQQKEQLYSSKVTNVNNVKWVLFIYQDGTFEQFTPKEARI